MTKGEAVEVGWIGIDQLTLEAKRLDIIGLLRFALWFAPVCLEKLDFYFPAGKMGEMGLLLAGWDG